MSDFENTYIEINRRIYKILARLGTGSSGNAFICRKQNRVRRLLNYKFVDASGDIAIKIAMGKRALVQAKRESSVLGELSSHPHIISLYDSQFDMKQKSCGLEMQVCKGGDLLSYIDKGAISEKKAGIIIYQVFLAISYAHRNQICHRDIKLENILFVDEDREKVVLADWGLAAFFDKTGSNLLQQDCGSMHYAAPEILANKPYFGPSVDAWSTGILLYSLVTAHFPFVGDTCESRLLSILSRKKPYFSPKISKPLQDLITNLLKINPNQRLSTTKALNHPFFKQFQPQLKKYLVSSQVYFESTQQQSNQTCPPSSSSTSASSSSSSTSTSDNCSTSNQSSSQHTTTKNSSPTTQQSIPCNNNKKKNTNSPKNSPTKNSPTKNYLNFLFSRRPRSTTL